MEKIITNQVICSSDRNLKENIQDIPGSDPSIVGKIKKVGIKSFNFKDDPLKNKLYGVIAQDVQEAGLGELVYKKEDETLVVDYTSLTCLKIAELESLVQSNWMTIVGMNQEISILKDKVEELEKKIKELENK